MCDSRSHLLEALSSRCLSIDPSPTRATIALYSARNTAALAMYSAMLANQLVGAMYRACSVLNCWW